MSKHLTSHITWLWIIALLSSTVGVSVHRIYCHCAGITSVSLYKAELPCSNIAEKQPESCCQKTKINKTTSSCCASKNDQEDAEECTDKASSKGGCMEDTIEWLKLKNDAVFDPNQSSPEFLFDFLACICDQSLFPGFFSPAYCQKAILPQYPKPPPKSGREIGQLYQVFRI